MARNAQPLEVKILKGTAHATRERHRAEIMPETIDIEATQPPAPAGLSEEGRELWDRLVIQQGGVGILFPSTLEYLVTYCRAFDLKEYFWQIIQKEGPFTEDKRAGQRLSQALKGYNMQIEIMLSVGAKLGLSPVDKTKISQVVINKNADKNSRKTIGVLG